MAMEHRRGLFLATFVSVIGVLVGIGGLAYYEAGKDAQLRAQIDGLSKSLQQSEAGRKELAGQVEKALELYGLVGSELSHQNEEIGVLLADGLGARDREIQKMRQSLSEIETRLTGVITSFRSDVEQQSGGLSSVRQELNALADRLGAVADSLESLDSRFRLSSEEVRSRLEAVPKAMTNRDQEAHDRIDSCLRRLEVVEGQIGTDLDWLQGEVRRVNGRLDDLGYAVRRLETRQSP